MQGINTPKEQPIEDEELESFRLQWLEEVSHKLNAPKSLTEEKSQIINAPAELSPTVHVPVSLPPSLSDAAYPRQSPQQSDAKSGYLVRLKAEDPGLEAYVRGSQHERMGNLSGAISSYREALKIDPTVEERFRKIVLQPSHPLHQRENELDPNLAFYTYYNFGEAKSTAATQNMETLITDLAAVNLELKPMYPTRSTVFLRFPGELVSLTVKWAFLLLGHEAIYNLSLVCQRMLRTCREPSVWRSACLAALKPEVGSASLEEELPLYQDSWFGMWLDHPRIRRDGVYISRVNYVRTGEAQSSWYAPVHVVTYYRYLRFFADELYMWTTTMEPALAVRHLSGQSVIKQKGVMRGTFEISYSTVTICMRPVDRPSISFTGILTLSSTHRGRQNKLSWKAYWQEKNQTPSYRSEIPVRTLRPFYFSKVKSFPASIMT